MKFKKFNESIPENYNKLIDQILNYPTSRRTANELFGATIKLFTEKEALPLILETSMLRYETSSEEGSKSTATLGLYNGIFESSCSAILKDQFKVRGARVVRIFGINIESIITKEDRVSESRFAKYYWIR
jgi:hypothetical protein